MNLKNFLKSIGGAVLTALPPYGPIALAAVNAVLPDDKKLDETATGETAMSAINDLPPDKRASLLESTLIEKHSTLRSMLAAESKNNHSTRPKIAFQSFQVYAACTLMITCVICVSIVKCDDPMTGVASMWPTLIALYGPFPAVIYAYFGMLRDEHKGRLNAANGHSVGAIGSILGRLISK